MRNPAIIGDDTRLPAAEPVEQVVSQTPVVPLAGQKDDNRQDIANKPPTREVGGREGPDPTRYGDWEKNGRCIDF